ncbi:carboxymuconolactone decarboxylase family protein [Planotetraspora sp. A-T 1434]|uniref:carboxymuconolactone decarboxylase family protein n=1 Tax=Planotetraspora sp. A-T 1434 TaxID=2979219 RepID=UPI0021C106B8|nr:carboxymuconolactone decarboxylase family protein [Planotetraspora sp. A-T 1434]MCT9933218.1 carboxymuconolactone decarboxylase family protein [Planotetraspora sp. A-T 1434]
MGGTLLTRATLRNSLTQVRHVSPVRPDAAGGLVAKVYDQVERDFGMLAPPMILHSPAPETLAASWLMLRESLLAAGSVTRAVREVVATTVSIGNACPYCVDVHRETLRGLSRGAHASEIAEGRFEAIPDPGVRRTAEWARAAANRDTAVRQALPAPPGQVGELVAVAVTFHYLNRMVNVFLDDSPLPPKVPAAVRGPALRLLGLLMRPAARRAVTPGASLDLLPAALLPGDMSWAGAGARTGAGAEESGAHIAGAFARAAAAIEAAGRRSVPDPVRELVVAELSAWSGRPVGPSRGWATDAVSVLPAAQRPAGRLALLTALASYQVDRSVVDDFRGAEPGDRALVELTAWASLAAAREVGSWSRVPVARPSRASTHEDNPLANERKRT